MTIDIWLNRPTNYQLYSYMTFHFSHVWKLSTIAFFVLLITFNFIIVGFKEYYHFSLTLTPITRFNLFNLLIIYFFLPLHPYVNVNSPMERRHRYEDISFFNSERNVVWKYCENKIPTENVARPQDKHIIHTSSETPKNIKDSNIRKCQKQIRNFKFGRNQS